MQLTWDQQRVVQTRDRDILVSAAAGSGKTAVLVQRILSRITDKDNPVDIDRLLIVTFTNAAAAEMRERIHGGILKRLEEDPQDENLQRQASLIHNAQITTIDSFCLFLLRNHFHEIGLDPGFRIADPGEVRLLEKEVLAEAIEDFYCALEDGAATEEEDRAFLRFCDAYAPDGKDRQIEELIERLYHCCMAHPWPQQWLDACREELKDITQGTVWKTQWMRSLWGMAAADLADALELAKDLLRLCSEPDGPYMYADVIGQDAEELERCSRLLDAMPDAECYETVRTQLSQLTFGRLPSKKDAAVSEEKRERAKQLRQLYKDIAGDLKENLFGETAARILDKEHLAAQLNLTLIRMTERYIEMLSAEKRSKNILDFSDAEHMALDVLLEGGQPTRTALAYREQYDEVMIDEYQDSNMVQEILLRAVAREERGQRDRFMVGDMKQSIYRFRLARPELFMEKYKAFQDGGSDHELICLKKNFRSRQEVLGSVNEVFEKVMRPQAGGIDYDADAALYAGAVFPKSQDEGEDLYKTEICLLDKDGMRAPMLRRAEARMIAQRIRQIVGTFPIADTDRPVDDAQPAPMRTASYRDIVILTRSEKGVVDVIRRELLAEGIPVYVSSREGYFSSQEISMLMDFLRVLNNPYDDIALCSALKSVFFGLDETGLSLLRTGSEQDTLYGCLQEAAARDERAAQITDMIMHYRRMAVVKNMTQLVSRILMDFQYIEYVSAMPAGQQRRANVEMFVEKTVDFERTSMHGLFHFIRYIEQMQKYKVEFGEASTQSEASDVVRIMTIHKSKGLEFPICFVACMDKKFNMEDMRKSVLMDADWGIASDYIDVEKRLRGETLSKRALTEKMKREAVGEEMRILYVAMTRAKEKLILTGGIDKPEEKLQKYSRLLEGRQQIPVKLLADAGQMLDFVLMAYAMGTAHLKLTQKTPQDLGLADIGSQAQTFMRREELAALCSGHMETVFSPWQEEQYRQLKEKFAFCYPHTQLEGLHTKTSVSELKRAAMEEAGLHPMFETEDTMQPYIPAFMRAERKPGGAERGSAVHRFLELLDFAAYAAFAACAEQQLIEHLKRDLDAFTQAGRITQEYAQLVPLPKIAVFLQSGAARRMMKAAAAGRLMREQPFVLSLAADRLDPRFPQEEKVLIQGIIDVCFEENGAYVILDYKTDRIESMEALYRRYKAQLDYYEEAVGRITGKRVREKILYSFALGQEKGWSADA